MDVTVKKVGLKVGILLSFLAMVTVNALANILPINGISTGEAADRYPNLFTPTPLTFAIWGAIYLFLLVYVIFQLLPGKVNTDPARQRMLASVGKLFILSSVLNAGWIFAWHYNQILVSMGLMLLILLCLMRIGWLLRVPHCSIREELALRIPFGLYFGWITVATIANATVLLVSLGWNGFGLAPELWMVIILIVGALIAIATMYSTRNVAYGLAVLWAFAGILYRHVAASGYGAQYTQIVVTVSFALGLLLASLAATGVHMRKVASCGVRK